MRRGFHARRKGTGAAADAARTLRDFENNLEGRRFLGGVLKGSKFPFPQIDLCLDEVPSKR
jgi:hypothetical protein